MFIELFLLSSTTSYWLTRHQDKSRFNQKLVPISSSNKELSFKKLFTDIKKVWDDDDRQRLLNDLNKTAQKQRQNTNRNLLVAVGSIIAALLGSIFPLFTVLSAVGVLYIARNLFLFIWRDLKSGRVPLLFIAGAITTVGMVFGGYLILAAVGSLIGRSLLKLIETTENYSEKQLVNVFENQPSKVWIEKNGVEIQVDFSTIHVGDVVIVNTGEIIPVDGQVQEGSATVDQHLLTGESHPIEKVVGDNVFAATLLLSGYLRIRVETAGKETIAAKIGQVLNDTQHYKDQLQARGRKIAEAFLPLQLAMSAITFLLMGKEAALTVLWSSLGINMIVFGPLSVLSYLQIFSRHGILIKDGRVLESLHKVDTIVFDKTGTLTLEQPTVGKIHCLGNYDEDTLLSYAAAAEHRQTHPIAKAIIDKAINKNLVLPNIDESSYEVGHGIKVIINGQWIQIGSARFMTRESIELPETVQNIQIQAEAEGISLIYIAIDQKLEGLLEMHPTIRPEAAEMIHYLKQRGIELYIISGDHEHPTRKMAEALGIDHYFAEVLPENKATLVKQLCTQGRFVCFIGDGINDGIALKSAQASISLKGASTVATDTAQIIFMDGTLNSLKFLFQLIDEFEQTMQVNLLASMVPGIVCIGGVYLLHFGIVAGMGLYYLSSILGLSNTLWTLLKYQDKGTNLDSIG